MAPTLQTEDMTEKYIKALTEIITKTTS